MEFNHVSVLLNECLEALNIKENGIYVNLNGVEQYKLLTQSITLSVGL